MNRGEMSEWLCDERLTLSTMLVFDELDTDEQKQRGEKFIEAIDLLQDFLCGHDPHETLPEAGRLVWLEFDQGEPSAGYWDEDGDSWHGQESVIGSWTADLDAVRRWYPLPGGGG